jgi:diaminopimelate decarboxylase
MVKAQGLDIRAISAGGGLSIPYRADETPIDPNHYFSLWDKARHQAEDILGHAVQLELEPGRYLVAESGVRVSEVRATKNMGRNHFILLDAGFTELMRPAMYGSYHGMSLIQRDGTPVLTQIQSTVVGGPLCESGDVFTQAEGGVLLKRELPQAKVGNYLVIEDAGAYGASMSSNYNSRPLAPEVLMEEGRARLIRRRQNLEDLLSLERV